MLGNTLVTHQTGPEGQPVLKVCFVHVLLKAQSSSSKPNVFNVLMFMTNQVLVHESISFERELYFCVLMDRAYNGPVIVASQRGGMDIEEVAAKSPGDIFTVI
jgi:succinyl-CoA synthetase beta subunit